MYIFKFILILLVILTPVESKEIPCTPKCKCDYFQNLRRATCEGNKLLNVKGNVPNATEILEFSYNYVEVLRDNQLIDDGLTSLKLANFSHNKIKDITIYAFAGMDKLKTLDLSNNALQYILLEWFWNLPVLEEFYLNNNNLGELTTTPIFTSNTLKVLNLAYCQIPHLQEGIFDDLENLEHLDVSHNFLNVINPSIFNKTLKLKEVNAKGNKLTCDGKMNDTIYFESDCKTEKIEKFQRMEMFDEQEDYKNSWIYNEEVTQQNDPPEDDKCHVIQLHREYNFCNFWAQVIIILMTFLFGLMMGILLTICKCSCTRPKRTQTRFSRIYTRTDILLADYDDPSQTTPAPRRRAIEFN